MAVGGEGGSSAGGCSRGEGDGGGGAGGAKWQGGEERSGRREGDRPGVLEEVLQPVGCDKNVRSCWREGEFPFLSDLLMAMLTHRPARNHQL